MCDKKERERETKKKNACRLRKTCCTDSYLINTAMCMCARFSRKKKEKTILTFLNYKSLYNYSRKYIIFLKRKCACEVVSFPASHEIEPFILLRS